MTTLHQASFPRFLTRTFLAMLLGLAPMLSATAQAPAKTEAGFSSAQKANLTEFQWDAFSQNTRDALASENEGLQISALRNIIRYGSRLDVAGSMTDVMHLYREHSDPQVRRMAVVALGRMDSDFAISYLQLMASHESNPVIRRTIRDVIYADRTGRWAAPPASLAQNP